MTSDDVVRRAAGLVRRLPAPLANGLRDVAYRGSLRLVRPHDVVVSAYPKSGSTWVRAVLVDALLGAVVGFDQLDVESPQLPGSGRRPRADTPVAWKAHYAPVARKNVRWLYVWRDPLEVAGSSLDFFHDGADVSGAAIASSLRGWGHSYGPWVAHVRRALATPGTVMLSYNEAIRTDGATLVDAARRVWPQLHEDALRTALTRNGRDAMRSRERESNLMTSRGFGGRRWFVSDVARNTTHLGAKVPPSLLAEWTALTDQLQRGSADRFS